MRSLWAAVGGAAVLGAGLLAFFGCGRPARLGPDEEVFREVDALFTAVTARRPDLVEQSKRRLNGLHAAGKLPDAARRDLAGVIGRAKAGRWETVAERRYDFMLAQRRDGAAPHKPTPRRGKG